MKKNDRAKLLKELDKLWSLAVRNRDKKCILCGQTKDVKKLQAHHWIKTRARSLKYRFDIRNGVSLCYGCHICQLHNNPTVDMIEDLTEKCIDSGIVTRAEIEEIKNDNETVKYSIGDLNDKINNLKKDRSKEQVWKN